MSVQCKNSVDCVPSAQVPQQNTSKPSRVAAQMCSSRESISILEGKIADMGVRLESILSPSMPDEKKQVDNVPIEEFSPLADEIRSIRYRIDTLINITNDYFDRLEL